MSYVIEAENYSWTPETGSVLTETTRTPYVHTQQVVNHLIEAMQERGDRFSGMEDWELETCRTWLTDALDRSDEIGDLHIGSRDWANFSIWTKL